MDKITVDILAPNQNKKDDDNIVFGVDTIARVDKGIRESKLNINSIIKKKKLRRKKLFDTYVKYYNKCIDEIKVLNNRNKTDLYFKVPLFDIFCNDYKPLDCIKFISNRIKKLFMDTYIIKDNLLFITWKFIEQNKKMANNTQ